MQRRRSTDLIRSTHCLERLRISPMTKSSWQCKHTKWLTSIFDDLTPSWLSSKLKWRTSRCLDLPDMEMSQERKREIEQETGKEQIREQLLKIQTPGRHATLHHTFWNFFLHLEQLETKFSICLLIQMNQPIVFAIRCLMERWLDATTLIVRSNGSILLVSVWQQNRRENGFVPNVQVIERRSEGD